MTRQEAYTLIEQLKKVFDIVRLVDAERTCKVTLNREGEFIRNPYHCYAVWNKEARCSNCVSMKVLASKSKITKFEYIDNDIYHVIAQYVEIDGIPFSLEIVSQITDMTLLGAYGQNKFIDTISKYNRRLYTDALTGAYNRYYLEDQLTGVTAVDALAVLDVDNLKEINDNYGHIAGDLTLTAVVGTVFSCLSPEDKLIRYGGDEFLLLSWNISYAAFAEKIELIRKKVSELVLDEFPLLRFSISIGAVCRSMPISDALNEADKMLYIAKESKNTVRIN